MKKSGKISLNVIPQVVLDPNVLPEGVELHLGVAHLADAQAHLVDTTNSKYSGVFYKQ